jgi:hypothetical protein
MPQPYPPGSTCAGVMSLYVASSRARRCSCTGAIEGRGQRPPRPVRRRDRAGRVRPRRRTRDRPWRSRCTGRRGVASSREKGDGSIAAAKVAVRRRTGRCCRDRRLRVRATRHLASRRFSRLGSAVIAANLPKWGPGSYGRAGRDRARDGLVSFPYRRFGIVRSFARWNERYRQKLQ